MCCAYSVPVVKAALIAPSSKTGSMQTIAEEGAGFEDGALSSDEDDPSSAATSTRVKRGSKRPHPVTRQSSK